MHSNRSLLFATLMAAAGFLLTTLLLACERSIGDDTFEIAQADEDMNEEDLRAEETEEDREASDPGTGTEEVP